jgi:hypothetical protein
MAEEIDKLLDDNDASIKKKKAQEMDSSIKTLIRLSCHYIYIVVSRG